MAEVRGHGGRPGAAAADAPAPARLLPCLVDDCSTGRWLAEKGGCLICNAPHCIKCGQLCPENGTNPDSAAGGAETAAAAKEATAAEAAAAAKAKAKGKGKAGAEKEKGKAKGHVCNPEDVKTHHTILQNTRAHPRTRPTRHATRLSAVCPTLALRSSLDSPSHACPTADIIPPLFLFVSSQRPARSAALRS